MADEFEIDESSGHIKNINSLKTTPHIDAKTQNFCQKLQPWLNIPDFAIITGVNGSGKSTLLSWINSILTQEKHKHLYISFFQPTQFNTSQNRSPLFPQNPEIKEPKQEIEKSVVQEIRTQRWDNPLQFIEKAQEMHVRKRTTIATHYTWQQAPSILAFYNTLEDEEQLSAEDFLQQMANEPFRTRILRQYAKKEVGRSPRKEVNEILKRYGFKYTLEKDKKNNSSLCFVDHNKNKIEANQLSSGEQLILTVISWIYCAEISKDGEETQIAESSSNKPKIILLDEPDRHLDPRFCKLFFEIVHEELVKRQGIQVIMTTHRFDSVALAPAEDISKFVSRVSKKALIYQETPDNNHSFYSAVALYLDKSQNELREEVASYIENNPSEYNESANKLKTGNGRTVKQYVGALRLGAECVDNLQINVLGKVLNRPIAIIDRNGIRNASDIERYHPEEPIFVFYNGRNHYDGLILNKDYLNKSYQGHTINLLRDLKRLEKYSPVFCLEENQTGKVAVKNIHPLRALFRMTTNMRSLTSYHHRVYTESTDDAKFYAGVYRTLRKLSDDARKPYSPSRFFRPSVEEKRYLSRRYQVEFYPVSTKGKKDGGCTKVISSIQEDQQVKVEGATLLSDPEFHRSYGILDKDGPNASQNIQGIEAYVVKTERYAIENYLFDPIVFCSNLTGEEIRDAIKDYSDQDKQDEFIKICEEIKKTLGTQQSETKQETLQAQVDKYFKVIGGFTGLSLEEKTNIEFTSNAPSASSLTLKYPRAFLEARGHSIENTFFVERQLKKGVIPPGRICIQKIIARIHQNGLSWIAHDLAQIFFKLDAQIRTNIARVIKPEPQARSICAI